MTTPSHTLCECLRYRRLNTAVSDHIYHITTCVSNSEHTLDEILSLQHLLHTALHFVSEAPEFYAARSITVPNLLPTYLGALLGCRFKQGETIRC